MSSISKTYPQYPLSQFPDSIDSFQYKKEPSAADITLINQYDAMISGGDFSGAAELLEQNPHLKEMQVAAFDYNKLLDALMTIQQWYQKDIHYYLATAAKQIRVSDAQPEGQAVNDFWIKPISSNGSVKSVAVYCMGEDGTYARFSPEMDAGTY